MSQDKSVIIDEEHKKTPAYAEGIEDFLLGKSIDDCPYQMSRGTIHGKRYSWLMGYMDEEFSKYDDIVKSKETVAKSNGDNYSFLKNRIKDKL